jgi:hypothetical protein
LSRSLWKDFAVSSRKSTEASDLPNVPTKIEGIRSKIDIGGELRTLTATAVIESMNTNLTKNGAELLLEQLKANVYRWNITLDDSRYNQL